MAAYNAGSAFHPKSIPKRSLFGGPAPCCPCACGRFNTLITAASEKKAEELAKGIKQGLQRVIAELQKAVVKEKELAPLLPAMKTVRVTVKNDTIALDAHGDAAAIAQGLRAWFMVRVEAGLGQQKQVPPRP